MSERGSAGTSERGSTGTSERDQLSEIIFMFLGFTFATGAHSISEKVEGFSPLWFPQGKLIMFLVSCNYCCICVSGNFNLKWAFQK